MRRIIFLKSLLGGLLGVNLARFFKPKKGVELAELMEGIEPGPGPFSNLPDVNDSYCLTCSEICGDRNA